MNIAAGLFLFIFGGLGVWLLTVRFPNARFMRIAYALMSLGGIVFVAWALTHSIVLGIAGIVLLVAGGVTGAIGALRKEMRVFPPA